MHARAFRDCRKDVQSKRYRLMPKQLNSILKWSFAMKTENDRANILRSVGVKSFGRTIN